MKSRIKCGTKRGKFNYKWLEWIPIKVRASRRPPMKMCESLRWLNGKIVSKEREEVTSCEAAKWMWKLRDRAQINPRAEIEMHMELSRCIRERRMRVQE